MLADWLEAARVVKNQAKNHWPSSSIFFQPIFPGRPLVLGYVDLELGGEFSTKLALKLKRSGVPKSLKETYKDWGGFAPHRLNVHGVLVKSADPGAKSRFIATHVETPTPLHNQVTVLNLLQVRGFITPLAFSGWMPTKDVCVTSLQARLELITQSIATAVNPRFLPVAPIGLELFNCMAFARK